jgi:hypothetical protein
LLRFLVSSRYSGFMVGIRPRHPVSIENNIYSVLKSGGNRHEIPMIKIVIRFDP